MEGEAPPTQIPGSAPAAPRLYTTLSSSISAYVAAVHAGDVL